MMATTATMYAERRRSNGRIKVSPMPPAQRDRINLSARDVMRATLRHRELTSVSGRLRESFMESGQPLAYLGGIVEDLPDTAEVYCAYLRGRAIREPASLDECITALVNADSDEEKAKAAYLRRPCAETAREWARQLRLQAARSIETARRLEEEHS